MEKYLEELLHKMDRKIEAECERLGDKLPYLNHKRNV